MLRLSREVMLWRKQRYAATHRFLVTHPNRGYNAFVDAQRSTPIWHWGCLLLLLAACGLLAWGAAWLILRSQMPPTGPRPTAIFWTTTPSPTATPTLTLAPPTPTVESTPLPAAALQIGASVTVTGTGGAGLSLRAAASRSAERLAVAFDGEAFQVIGGPLSADGLMWWQLQSLADPQLRGWAAANYLRPAR